MTKELPSRTIVSKDFLLKYINDNLQRQDGCEKCSFQGVTRLAETDDTGCNWSADVVRVAGVDPFDYGPGAAAALMDAQKKYNLE